MSLEDVNSDYVIWLNDPEVNKFLECRFVEHTLESTQSFVQEMKNSSNNVLLGIFDQATNLHIGNIKIGNICKVHSYADVGIIIGNKAYWGKGIATEAIKLATDYAFNELKIHKLYAGAYEFNEGSTHAFIKAGYVQSGIFKEHYKYNGKYINSIYVEKINKENL